MAELGAPKKRGVGKAGVGVACFLVGCLFGCVGGIGMGSSGASTSGGVKSAATTTSGASPTAPAAPADKTASATPAETFPLTVGEPKEEAGSVIFPVVVQNASGQEQDYIQADCSFYDKGGALVAHAMTNWQNVGAGDRASNDLIVMDGNLDRLDRYECRAHGS